MRLPDMEISSIIDVAAKAGRHLPGPRVINSNHGLTHLINEPLFFMALRMNEHTAQFAQLQRPEMFQFTTKLQ
jgi:hypothetical protein